MMYSITALKNKINTLTLGNADQQRLAIIYNQDLQILEMANVLGVDVQEGDVSRATWAWMHPQQKALQTKHCIVTIGKIVTQVRGETDEEKNLRIWGFRKETKYATEKIGSFFNKEGGFSTNAL